MPTSSWPRSRSRSADLDRVADALERVVGVDEEDAVVGQRLRVGLEGLALVVEGHHPAVGVGAAHRDAEEPAGEHVRGGVAAADVGRAGGREPAVDALGAAQAELEDRRRRRAARHDPRRLGRDQRLEVDEC